MADTDTQWFYDLATGEVSQGKTSGWENRMGPYSSEAEAREALATAARRNEEAEAQDREDEDWS
ncbi:hypothetical protein L1O03_03390 [Corynebacterium uropygiale]|uniref:SPOR domain-containing protein n=1 Tax=Corynebacterium uropygiale TaxID=1775911 RepID=A0A9X1QNJ0_9CORY|nr:hypothetical protein [Corynebacterium uropygiale]MCF4006221.1 hypothetical protein [Corynebacterium uropygiale]